MKKNIASCIVIFLVAASLTACSSTSIKNRDVGAIGGATVGAVAGGLITHNVAGAAVGAAAGGIGGYYIGKSTEKNN